MFIDFYMIMLYLMTCLLFIFLLFLYIFLSVLMKNKNFMIYLMSLYKWSFFLFLGFFMLSVFINSFSFFFSNEMNYFLSYSLVLVFDMMSFIFVFMAVVVSWSIMKFSVDYMVDEKGNYYFISMLLIFLVFMFLLVLSNNFIMLMVGWESVGLMSFMLISWWGSRSEAVISALQAVIYNRVSDASVVMFIILLVLSSSGVNMSGTVTSTVFFFLLILSVLAKSSQLFFHPWLPNAMEGPTPVSSLLHSSTMVVASVFLLMRCSDLFNLSYSVFYMSLLTCMLSGFLGFNHFDMKKVVAYSTTSQLGFMIMMLSLGFKFFCLFYIVVHAFFKAMLFMMSSVVIHMKSSGQDFRSMNVLMLLNKNLFKMLLISSLVMMSMPFVSGFWIKDLFLENLFGTYLGFFVYLMTVFSVMLTGMYSMRLFFSLFSDSTVLDIKMYVFSHVMSLFPFYRLFVGSIVVGLYMFYFFSNFTHFSMLDIEKYLPLFIFVMMIPMVYYVLLTKGMGMFFSLYLLNYNPFLHKIIGLVYGTWSGLLSMFDTLFMEWFFMSSVLFSRSKLFKYNIITIACVCIIFLIWL